ncbi:cobalamin-binding protein [Catellatospora tritici]|uniref:cobalamin-binding protein n=1 Tax=Catellatospora tritici TaxID=2851566 RepID=UPI001C2DCADB|nr:cobalamin-binding protein [Catellatospora tritici]MBV1853624.1 cobalamin-binding protein [Catellatospora tritici]
MRIVSLLPAATDIVASLGALDQLVGRTHECDWPPGELDDVPVVTRTGLAHGLASREINLAVAGAHQGSGIYDLDHDAIEALRPDLILTQDLCDVCAVSYQTVNEAVRVMRLDTTVVSLQPRTIEEILTAVTTVGELIGASPAAAEVVTDARRRLAALPGPSQDGPRVLFVEWLEPLMPGGHWVPEQIAYGGGRSLLTSPGEHSTPYPLETVVALDPDVILVGPCGFTSEQTRAELPSLVASPGWEAVAAVKAGRVYVVDGPAYFNRPGPRVVDGAEIVSRLLAR